MNGSPPITIMLVDDDEAKRYSVARILRRAYYQVKEVVTGAEALRAVAEKPDLIILDVKLPDISGFEICRRIKADPSTANIPVLHMSTTFVDIEDKVHGLDGGADAYLTDILEPIELIATVKALLRTRNAEEAAQLKVRQWQTTFDAINDGIILLGVDGRILQVNKALVRIMGTSPQEPIGMTFHEFLQIDPDSQGSPFVRMMETGIRESVELMRANRWLKVAVDPVHGPDGSISGALSIISNITDRRILEEQLRSRANELAAADARKDEFLAMLAHELRNPLAPILNSLEVIRLIGPVERGVEQALAIAGRQVRHMARLLDDLLDVSRFTRGKIRLHFIPINLIEVVQHAVDSVKPRALSQEQTLVVKIPPGPIRLDGDPTRLEQVIGNLLNNAVKYSDKGGTIELQVYLEDGFAVIRVRDEGIGLSPDMLAHVFDLFSQADLSLDRAQGGLGIGLTLVKSLVELHGGTVIATSPGPGLGSEFIVKLPLTKKVLPSDEPTADSADSAQRPAGHSVLVVDDHADSATSLAQILKYWGHEVAVAHEGPEAIDLVAVSNPFDLVLLDIGLPGMDGYQVAERLRSLKGTQHLEIVALTGYGQKEDIRRSQEVGIDAHLVKPVDLTALQNILDKLRDKSPLAASR